MVKGKILRLSTPYGQYDVRVARKSYASNGSLAVVLYYDECGQFLPFGSITVNIEDGDNVRARYDLWILAKEGKRFACQYVDTNNFEYVVRFLEENKIAFFTGGFADSGYCSYPLYAFDLDKLAELERG